MKWSLYRYKPPPRNPSASFTQGQMCMTERGIGTRAALEFKFGNATRGTRQLMLMTEHCERT